MWPTGIGHGRAESIGGQIHDECEEMLPNLNSHHKKQKKQQPQIRLKTTLTKRSAAAMISAKTAAKAAGRGMQMPAIGRRTRTGITLFLLGLVVLHSASQLFNIQNVFVFHIIYPHDQGREAKGVTI
jgi:hypothetical protein